MNATQQKFKPILFSTEMVQAILAGRKTQTRRVCSHQFWQHSELTDFNINKIHSKVDRSVSSKYQPGDILWLRETYGTTAIGNMYKASVCSPDMDKPLSGWKPSIFMPKEAARIFLKVTNVRVERLQDISENDAIAEGIDFFNHGYGGSPTGIWYRNYKSGTNNCSPKYSFQTLWQSINEKKHPWESNPWVWVYTFERIEKPKNFN